MPVPATQSDGLPGRLAQTLLSPWSRFALLLALLCAAATTMLLYEPQRFLADGWPPQITGSGAVALFGAAYGLCTAAFVPRPVLNLAAGALFGAQAGTFSATAGTVIGAGIAFGLGRLLGQDALRPLLRARWLAAADRQMSRRGFRAMLIIRLLPGVPFAASNYGAAVSRMRWSAFLSATAVGSLPNTAAYVLAGSTAATPTSPVFLASFGFIALSALAGAVVAWRKRAHLRGTPAPGASTTPDPASDPVSGSAPGPASCPSSALSPVPSSDDDPRDERSDTCLGLNPLSSDSSRA
ncbi:TVP38/TMEM64 family protein [Streptomyces iconiensis]|uniref:TVP38/TMEM64 family membrane protein n=1 Tax=Streptomyces iconiensis TaxID=1384038 RepID=A0ABT7A2Q7_9ACTN|nr:TVP38/TMEM64 family protein [Streptomyces iconiensis]MDJ1135623.1 VTT domain-containing protein [Streptomyces iconiensis]